MSGNLIARSNKNYVFCNFSLHDFDYWKIIEYGVSFKKKGIYPLSNDTKYSDDYVLTREIARPVINHTRVSKLLIGVCIHRIYLHHIIFPLLELKTRYTSLSHSCKWILAIIISNDNILVMLWNRYIWWCWHFTSYKIFLLTQSFFDLGYCTETTNETWLRAFLSMNLTNDGMKYHADRGILLMFCNVKITHQLQLYW